MTGIVMNKVIKRGVNKKAKRRKLYREFNNRKPQVYSKRKKVSLRRKVGKITNPLRKSGTD